MPLQILHVVLTTLKAGVDRFVGANMDIRV